MGRLLRLNVLRLKSLRVKSLRRERLYLVWLRRRVRLRERLVRLALRDVLMLMLLLRLRKAGWAAERARSTRRRTDRHSVH